MKPTPGVAPIARATAAWRAALAVIALALCCLPPTAAAQAYPNKPVRLVVPAPPGGLSDVVARSLSQWFTERLGQPFIVENRPGANGVIGSEAVAKSTPDGYTLLVYPSIFVITPMLVKSVRYDVLRDFTPVSLLGTVPLVLVVHPSMPIATARDFVALAKSGPRKLAFGLAGVGSISHLLEARMERELGFELLLVPYKGAAPAVLDLVGGRVNAMMDPIPLFLEHIRAGKVRAIAVSNKDRIPVLPDVPTMAESGFPGVEEGSWYGLWGPTGLPREVIEVLNREIAQAMKTPAFADRLTALGFVPLGTRADDFAAFMKSEVEKYGRVIREANIKVEE